MFPYNVHGSEECVDCKMSRVPGVTSFDATMRKMVYRCHLCSPLMNRHLDEKKKEEKVEEPIVADAVASAELQLTVTELYIIEKCVDRISWNHNTFFIKPTPNSSQGVSYMDLMNVKNKIEKFAGGLRGETPKSEEPETQVPVQLWD